MEETHLDLWYDLVLARRAKLLVPSASDLKCKAFAIRGQSFWYLVQDLWCPKSNRAILEVKLRYLVVYQAKLLGSGA